MHAPAGICIYKGPDLRIEFMNPACERICGQEGLAGKTFDEAFPDLKGTELREAHFRVLETGELFKERAVPVERDFGNGVETRYFDLVLQPARVSEGGVQGLETYSFDVTDMVRAQQVIRSANERESLLAEANRTLMSTLDYGQTLKYVVQTATESFADWCAVFLVDHAEDPRNGELRVLRARVAELDANSAELRTAVAGFLRGREIYEGTADPVSRVLSTGKRVVANPRAEGMLRLVAEGERGRLAKLLPETVIAVPMTLTGRLYGVIVYASMDPGRRFGPDDYSFAQKLTDQSTLAVSNAELYCQLKNSLKARDELLSVCSHELRTPLTSLKLQADMTKRIFASGGPTEFSRERIRKFVELSDRQLDRLTRLIEEMLDFSRISGGRLKLHKEPMDLEDLLKEQVERMAPQASAANCLLCITSSEPVVGEWDRFRLEQVFTNLIGNACKYGAGRPISIRLSQTPSLAVVHVLDEGMGIAKEDQDRIFRPYERVASTEHVGGLGLGLYISEQVVAAHGGSIHVNSVPGRGSDFVVELPKSLARRELH